MEAETFKTNINIEMSRINKKLEEEMRLRLDFEFKIN